MRYPCIILVLVQTFAGYGQERFYNLVEGWSNNHSFEYNNGYGALGLEIVGSPFDHRFVIDYLDFGGLSINQNYFFVDSLETTSFRSNSSNNVLEYESSLLIASYIGNTSNFRIYGTLFEYMLPNGSFELIAIYDFDLFNQLVSIAQKNDSTLLMGGLLSDNEGYNRALIMDTDMEGEVRWTFESACGIYCLSRIQQILPLSDGGIGVLFYEFDASLPTWEETKRSVLLKLSSEGEEEWRTYLGDWEDFQIDPGGIVEVDGEIIVSYTDPDYWNEDLGPQGQYAIYIPNTVHLAYFNLQGELQTEISLIDQIPNGTTSYPGRYQYELSQMQQLDDGNLLLTGTTGKGAYLLKTSTAGDVLWSREHMYIPWDFDLNANQQDNYIYHALPTSDGGFLCTGEYRHYPVPGNPTSEQSAIALKVDEFGCLEPGCQLADGLFEDELGTLAVYPNPTSGELRVLLPSRLGLGYRSTTEVEVFDAMGRRVPNSRFKVQDLNGSGQESITLNLESLPSGAYLVRIVTEQGLYSALIMKE